MILFTLIAKNIKQLIRSKTSSLIVLLGPLIIIALLGFAFNNVNEYALNIGVHSKSASVETTNFISALEANNYIITQFESETECIESIKDSSLHACIVFPKDMTVSQNYKPEINFYVDSSNENIVFNVISAVSEKLNLKNKEYSRDLINGIITTVNSVDSVMQETKPLVETIKADNSVAKTNSNSINSNIQTLNLEYTPMDISSMDSMALRNDARFSELLSKTKTFLTNLNPIISDLEDIKDSLSSGNSTSEANDLQSSITSLKNKINDTKKVVYSNTTNYTSIRSSIQSMISDINNMQTKINSAKESNQKIKSSVDSLNEKLTAISTNLNLVSANIQNIENSLNSLKIKNPDLVSSPYDVRINFEKPNHFKSMFAGMIIIVLMFVSLLLSTHMVIKERESQAYFRNAISPINSFLYVMAMYFTNLIIAGIQIAIMILFAVKYFKLTFAIYHMLLVLFICVTLFSFIGMIIGYLFSSEETATIASVSIAAVLMFLSDLIIPIESIPRIMLKYVIYNPVYRFKIIINMFNNNNPNIILNALQNEFFIYAGVLMGLLIITLVLCSNSRKNYTRFFHFRKASKKIK